MKLAYKWQAAIVGAFGMFMAVLDNTVVNVALPQMQASFHASLDTITWVVTGYFLAQAAVIPITGYLSDKIGTKPVFLTALAVFTTGSALCAVAPHENFLIAFRVFQGIGGGALMPVVFTIVYRVFPPTERGPVTAVVGVPVLLAPAFGPTIGGYLTTTFDWSAIFTVNIPLGVIAFILAILVLRGRAAERKALAEGEAQPGKKPFDVIGLALAMLGFTALVYGITEAGPRGWADGRVLLFLIGGAVVVLLFTSRELYASDPVMDMRLFLNRTFTMANIVMWAISAFLFGSLLLLPLFFEQVQGKTPLTAGEILISQGLAAAVAMAIAGRLYNRVGPRWLAFAGMILVTAGSWGLTQMDLNTSGAALQVWLVLRGLGLGMTNVPLQTLALSVVSNRAMAKASSLLSVSRMIFSAVGAAVFTAYVTRQATAHATAAQATIKVPATVLQQLQAACAARVGQSLPAIQQCVQSGVKDYITQQLKPAIVMGFTDTFMLATIGCAVCILLTLLLGRDPAIEAARRAKERGETVEERPPLAVAE
jgi:EmrB/QacA subfamily drug resistance transporter